MIGRSVYKVRLRFINDLLGTVPLNKAVYDLHIATKAKEAMENAARRGIPLADGTEATSQTVEERVQEEVANIQDAEERGRTGFFVDPQGERFIGIHMIRGYLAAACKAVGREIENAFNFSSLSMKLKRHVFIRGMEHTHLLRRWRIYLPHMDIPDDIEEHPMIQVEDDNTLVCQRSIRIDSFPQQRVAVGKSDAQLLGSEIEFLVFVLDASDIDQEMIEELFCYGAYEGLGQWRSAGFGSFDLVSVVSIDPDTMAELPRKPKRNRPAKKPSKATAKKAAAQTADDEEEDNK